MSSKTDYQKALDEFGIDGTETVLNMAETTKLIKGCLDVPCEAVLTHEQCLAVNCAMGFNNEWGLKKDGKIFTLWGGTWRMFASFSAKLGAGDRDYMDYYCRDVSELNVNALSELNMLINSMERLGWVRIWEGV